MVERQSPQLDELFHALSDGTRRRMLETLRDGPRSVGELAAPFQISLAAASKHIKVLEGAGLLSRQVQGRTHLCRLSAAPMHAGAEWLRHYEGFWNRRLDTLETLLRADEAARTLPSPSRRRKPPRERD